MKYKCNFCKLILQDDDLKTGNCPECAGQVSEMCENDNHTCVHDVTETLAYCSICGEPVCPICNCHDVSQISRVTGYMADVSGFNEGKKQELKDRHRVDI